MLTTVSSALESVDKSQFGAQDYVNNATSYDITKKGGMNKLHSTFNLNLTKNVVGNQNPVFDELQPCIKIDDSNINWNKAYRIVISFLRKYQMEDTLHAMRLEYPNVPKHTGLTKTSELNRAFNEILDYNDGITRHLSLADKVRELSAQVNLPPDTADDDRWDPIELSTCAQDQELTIASTTIEQTLEGQIAEAKEKILESNKPKSPRMVQKKVRKDVEPEKIKIRVRKHDENGETYVHHHKHHEKKKKPEILSTKVTKTEERKVSPGGTPRIVVKKRIVKVQAHYIHPDKEKPKKMDRLPKPDTDIELDKLPKPNTEIELEPLDLDDFDDQIEEPKTPERKSIPNYDISLSQSSESEHENVAMTLPGPESPSTIDKLQSFIDGKKSSATLDDGSIFRHKLQKSHTLEGFFPARNSKRYKDGSLMKKRLNDPLARLPKNHSIEDEGIGYHLTKSSARKRASSASRTGTYSGYYIESYA